MAGTLVYRVEHPDDGEGPYVGREWPDKVRMRFSHNDSRHKAPHGDPALGYISHREVCGCTDPASLREWFATFWDGLAAGGFVVRIFEARGARVGARGQVVFNPEYAEPLGRMTAAAFVDWYRRYDR